MPRLEPRLVRTLAENSLKPVWERFTTRRTRQRVPSVNLWPRWRHSLSQLFWSLCPRSCFSSHSLFFWVFSMQNKDASTIFPFYSTSIFPTSPVNLYLYSIQSPHHQQGITQQFFIEPYHSTIVKRIFVVTKYKRRKIQIAICRYYSLCVYGLLWKSFFLALLLKHLKKSIPFTISLQHLGSLCDWRAF